MLSLAKESISTFGARIIVFFISIGIGILIARILGPEGKGIWEALMFIPFMTFTLLNLGIPSSNVYFTGSRKYSLEQLIDNSLFIISIILLLIFFIYFFGFNWIYQFLTIRYQGFTRGHLYLTLIAIPFVFIFNYLNGVLQGKEKIYTINIISIVSKILSISGILIALLFFRMGLLGLVWVYLLVRIINTIVILFVIKRITLIRPRPKMNPDLIRDTLKYGSKSYLADSFQVLNYRVDVFLIFGILGARPLGFYMVGVAASEVLWFVSQSIAFPLFPRISSLGRETAQSLIPISARIIFLSSFFLALILAGVAHWLIPFFYGAEFILSIKVIYILLPGILLYSPLRSISSYFAGIGKPEVNILVGFTTLMINIALNLILIRKMGIYGAALASSISYSLTYAFFLILYRYETKMSPIEFFNFKLEDFRKIRQAFTAILTR
ncbi:polysaccharide biosynthesis C-terminal domain-containing protein [candidate division WOR-3 bacterium]|nr:polysaccharide biosynthesis C-terminal domain-containing protein [candidate division WOR-3 bacterium]